MPLPRRTAVLMQVLLGTLMMYALVVIVIRIAYPYGDGQFLNDLHWKASRAVQWVLEWLGLAKPPVYPT